MGTRGSRRGGRPALVASLLVAATAVAQGPVAVEVAVFRGSNTLMQRVAGELTAEVTTALDELPTVRRLGPVDLAALPSQQPVEAWAWPPEAPRRPCDPRDAGCLAGLVAPDEAGAPAWLLVGYVSGGRQVHRVEVALVSVPGGEVAWRSGEVTGAADAVVEPVAEAVMRVMLARGYVRRRAEGQAVLEPLVLPEPPPPVTTPRDPAWITLGTGAALLLGGAGAWVPAGLAWDQLHSHTWRATHYPWELDDLAARYRTSSTVGTVMLSVGAAGVAAGLLWAFLPGWLAPPTVTLTPSGAGLALSGRW